MSRRIKVLFSPDSQVKPGVNTDHLAALGNYVKDKRPDVIVNAGDWFDLPSLSTYTLEGEREGARYADDIKAGRDAMERFTKPFRDIKGYSPRMEFLLGNHENRVNRTLNENPKLKGTISTDDFQLKSYGWKVNPFLKVISIGGVQMAHYFISGAMGRPVSSAAALLRERQGSAIQGHVQSFQYAVHPRTQQFAMFAGIFYTHQEDYLGPQGNTCRPMVHVLHECRDGIGDAMQVSADFLLRRYA